ncbi:MAG TPA: hypothetical protein EYH40_03610 [Desulfurococcales archaeon]|nr:hypothetical protein [Desulfurococcales archaeon]
MASKDNIVTAKILDLIIRRPWIIPFIIKMIDIRDYAPVSKITEAVGVRSAITRRALWHLSKIGLIDRIERRNIFHYKIKDSYIDLLRKILSNTIISRNQMAVLLGGTYYLISIKHTRISVWTIPKSIVDNVKSILKQMPGQCFKPSDVALALSISPRIATLALRTLYVLGEVKKTKTGYEIK